MATAPDARSERLWFDAEPATRGPARLAGARRRLREDPAAERQMELRMPPPRPAPAPRSVAPVATPAPLSVPVPVVPAARPAPVARPAPAYMPEPEPAPEASQPFGAWLLEQGSGHGTLGELAKAAKADRLFPRRGDAEAVRARFSAAGADGDAFEALDDAERDYERQRD